MFVYLDNSGTTRQYDEVTRAMVTCMENEFGNPSSMHGYGMRAEKKVKEARKKLADSFSVDSANIYFTSGGTESDNTAIFQGVQARSRQGNKIITSQVEHPAVLEAFKKLEKEGFDVIYLPVDKNCKVSVKDYQDVMDDKVIFTSIMTVNNEVGTIEPIEEMYRLKNQKSIFHTDAVQALGKVKIPYVDMISVSAHKIHGPKGVGALVIKPEIKISPLIVGGGQEKNMRSGTENVPAIVGFGEAAKLSHQIDKNKIKEAKLYLQKGIEAEIKDIKINTPEESVGTILNVSFLGTRSEVILHSLEEKEIYVSAGSACASNKKGKSHVLAAMGAKDDEIEGAIRFSLNQFNTIKEMDYVIENLKGAVDKFRKLGSFR